jgi:DNA-binding XRE family transcriptional regulator
VTVEEFADRLRMQRLKCRIRQGALAAQLGVAQQTLCRWENGARMTADLDHGTTVCDPCLEAHRSYQRDYMRAWRAGVSGE